MKICGSGIKKMRTLAILAIIVILILHAIRWAPIISESSKVREKRESCERYERRYYGYHSSSCNDCEEYNEQIREYNAQGAALWQSTITSGVLIACCGAVAYGVGVMVEMKQLRRPEDNANNGMQ